MYPQKAVMKLSANGQDRRVSAPTLGLRWTVTVGSGGWRWVGANALRNHQLTGLVVVFVHETAALQKGNARRLPAAAREYIVLNREAVTAGNELPMQDQSAPLRSMMYGL
jgi:hypothetical protein